jgi:hypothetical protein
MIRARVAPRMLYGHAAALALLTLALGTERARRHLEEAAGEHPPEDCEFLLSAGNVSAEMYACTVCNHAPRA